MRPPLFALDAWRNQPRTPAALAFFISFGLALATGTSRSTGKQILRPSKLLVHGRHTRPTIRYSADVVGKESESTGDSVAEAEAPADDE